jgi:hypothetical protein
MVDMRSMASTILEGQQNQYATRSKEVDAGLIILMHDADKNTDIMLPKLIQTLRDLGAQFSPLPRPGDMPNTKTVGIGYEPTYQPTPTS